MATKLNDMEAADVGALGERCAVRDLQGRGFTCVHDTKLPGSTDIEATKPGAKRLIQVKSAVHPNAPSDLNSDETRNIKARAAKLGCIAFLAKVVLREDAAGKRTYSITYHQLP